MKRHKGITDEFIKKIPYALEAPIMILEPDMKDENSINSRSNSVAVYTDIMNDADHPVLAVFTFKHRTGGGYIINDTKFITNAYFKKKK